MDDRSDSQQIDDIIKGYTDWRGDTLSKLRVIIMASDPDMEELVKWKKPSRPQGVPVWYHGGNVCIGEALKSAVRLTFPNGAHLTDPSRLFNTRLDSTTVRAVDFRERQTIDEQALSALIRAAIT